MIHNLSMLTFPSVPYRKLLVWSRRTLKVNRLLRTLKLNSLTFLKSPKFSASGHGVVRLPGLNFYLGFLFWHLWMTHLPPRAGTPAFMLHLTNPCAKRKVLSLTKPKGKIYKTKSLGHYFTHCSHMLLKRKTQKTVSVLKKSVKMK